MLTTRDVTIYQVTYNIGGGRPKGIEIASGHLLSTQEAESIIHTWLQKEGEIASGDKIRVEEIH